MSKFFTLWVFSLLLVACGSMGTGVSQNSEGQGPQDVYSKEQIIERLKILYGENNFSEVDAEFLQETIQSTGLAISTIYYDSVNGCQAYFFESSAEAEKWRPYLNEKIGASSGDAVTAEKFSILDKNLVIFSESASDWLKEKSEQPCLNKW